MEVNFLSWYHTSNKVFLSLVILFRIPLFVGFRSVFPIIPFFPTSILQRGWEASQSWFKAGVVEWCFQGFIKRMGWDGLLPLSRKMRSLMKILWKKSAIHLLPTPAPFPSPVSSHSLYFFLCKRHLLPHPILYNPCLAAPVLRMDFQSIFHLDRVCRVQSSYVL